MFCESYSISNSAKVFSTETSCEHVSGHITSRTIDEFDFTGVHMFSNKVVFNINMFGASMELRVVSQCDSRLVILENLITQASFTPNRTR